uniref:Macaca fascicularis brain cDNA clone: QtrA-16208, similar to human transmembrane protein 24 (TMEM24), mRNA, RefSeq: NM_014807.3 n=1 Tax=Macaca fascicularis TaxID=9541 RepID=I7GJB7_MACFA|nr:unnamed protein product [Macaca fascicularis]
MPTHPRARESPGTSSHHDSGASVRGGLSPEPGYSHLLHSTPQHHTYQED